MPIGVALLADGFDFHIPRGYVYFVMAFAAAVETFNILTVRRRQPSTRGGHGRYREGARRCDRGPDARRKERPDVGDGSGSRDDFGAEWNYTVNPQATRSRAAATGRILIST
jgi:hypothetical protein